MKRFAFLLLGLTLIVGTVGTIGCGDSTDAPAPSSDTNGDAGSGGADADSGDEGAGSDTTE